MADATPTTDVRCKDCGDTGIIEWDDRHGEARSDRCHCQPPPRPRVLAWAALGMRDKGIGEYVELRDYERLERVNSDLLAALKKIVEWQDEVKNAVPRIYLDNAQRAIAKAEGRS